MRALHVLALVPLGLTVACGGQEFTALQDSDAGEVAGAAGSATTGGGGSAGSTGTHDAGSHAGSGGAGSGVDGGRTKNSGDCESTADCGGDPCVDISSGGYRACVAKVPEATACSSPPGGCCKSADCAASAQGGKCILGPPLPMCGGPLQIPSNVCAVDQCKSASDCSGPNAICVPAGVFGRKVASCMTGGCRRDSDCTQGKGGACLPIAGGCCPGPIGLFCVYEGGCVNQGDCPNGHCETSTGTAVCAPGGVACAAAL